MAPRDGSNIYHQPFPNVVTDTEIESAVYNGFTNDVAADLNAPRPISAGGTGASNAHDAMIALGGEIAGQVVTNYDSFPWVAGSFSSVAGATAAPTANAFSGIVYVTDSANMVVEARDSTTGYLYVRRKVTNVWGAWAQQAGSVTDLDTAYVNVGGDTMTGGLNIVYPGAYGASLKLRNSTGGFEKVFRIGLTDQLEIVNTANTAIIAALIDTGAWTVAGSITAGNAGGTGAYFFGNSGSKYLNYDGTNFNLVGGSLLVNSSIYCGYGGSTGTYFFGNTSTKYLQYDGSNFNFVGGTVYAPTLVGGNVWSQVSATTGTFYFGTSGSKYLQYDGTNFTLVGGALVAPNNGIYASPSAGFNCNGYTGTSPFVVYMLTGNPNWGQMQLAYVHQSGVWAGPQFDIGGVTYQFRSDGNATKSLGGTAWIIASDARAKTIHGDYTSNLDMVAALRPVRFTYKNNTAPPTDEPREAPPQIKAPAVHVGLIAQDAEKVMPELFITEPGYIDGKAVTDLRSADYSALTFALVNCIKELKMRIEALEAR